MRARRAAIVLAGVLLATALPAGSAGSAPEFGAIEVSARPIRQFDSGSQKTRFGKLTFVGGLELRSSNSRFGSLSAFRFTDSKGRFLAVSDTGLWIEGRLLRDEDGRPAEIREARIEPILDADGQPATAKRAVDAESLAIFEGQAVVGFEGVTRIATYSPAADPARGRAHLWPLPIPRKELRANQGLEAIATPPASSPLAGKLVTVSEHSLDASGNLLAAIFDSQTSALFSVRRDENWDVSDGAFLPEGDLLLLERRYTGILHGIDMRIRRVAGQAIRPGALVDGPVIMEADLSQEIDNMEGLEVSLDPDGTPRLTLVSDDNGNFFQRTLLLEFRLEETAGRQTRR
ncbi:esterase-like activity of phytase family protein [Consotaella salsifontis]|uniref:Phytase-like domain-containing protein n=1 Tax=Consotaella salsifontis TaxID=1365950 RepID=A0A1T4QN90_9HYPH|nr:esterase-like activity of phytase family protein [Consotaella salsifontis]SKA05233.1 hypothetical protein SAMN05428963_105145 [Consotaella salsifontis]